MAAFSDYLETGILNHTLRGTSLAVPSRIFMALFTSDPTDAATGTELADSAYVRQDMAKGGSIASGWTAPATLGEGKASSNAHIIQFPPIADGTVTATHYALFDSQMGGNLLYHGSFTVSKTLEINDVLSIAVGGLQVVVR